MMPVFLLRSGSGDGQVERTVGKESLSRGLGEQDLMAAKQAVNFVALFEWDEEDLAWAVAPAPHKIVVGEEDGRGIWKGRAKEHGRGASVYKINDSAKVEGYGRAVGLVAVEEDLAVAGDGVLVLKL